VRIHHGTLALSTRNGLAGCAARALSEDVPAPRRRPGWTRLGEAGPALLAAILAAAAWGLGLHGTDLAAQLYRVGVVRRHGLVLWDPGWFGGYAPPAYSVLAPALGAIGGLRATAVAWAALAAGAFARLVPRRLGGWYFAAGTLVPVAVGQYPYLAGEAVGLAGLLAARRGWWPAAAALGVVSALLSPLSAAFLVLAAGVWAATSRGDLPGRKRRERRALVAAAVGAAAPIGVIGLAFPGDGPFPFAWSGLVVVELLCALAASPLLSLPTPLRIGTGLYGVSTLASFLVANPLGGNAPRLAASVGVALVAGTTGAPGVGLLRIDRPWGRHRGANPSPSELALGAPAGVAPAPPSGPATSPTPAGVAPAPARPGWSRPGRPGRGWVLAVLVPFALWQWAPMMRVSSSLSEPAADRGGFYQPLIARLVALGAGTTTRVEVVPTADHAESAYVASRLPIARGWERQLDIADNPLFYRNHLDAGRYLSWLRANGISWVALARTQLDYAGRQEAALLRSGVPGLVRVWRSTTWTVWEVTRSPGLLSGAGRLIELRPDRVVVTVRRPGSLLLRVRWTRYWTVDAGAACVSPDGPWTRIEAVGEGRVVIGVSLLATHCHRDALPERRRPG
jgi:hypothetical protein